VHPPSPQLLALAFHQVEVAAVAGERCPVNGTGAVRAETLGALARAGSIKIEVSGRNWRTVPILKGPHAGKTTKPDPSGGHVYRTIGTTTSFTPQPISQLSPSHRARRERAACR
jgi:hypothetical protein